MYTTERAKELWEEKLAEIPGDLREDALKTVLEYLCFEDPHFIAWKKIDNEMPPEVSALAKASDMAMYSNFSQGKHADPESALAKKNAQAWQAAHNMVAGIGDKDLRSAFVTAMRAMVCNPYLSSAEKCDKISHAIETTPILGQLMSMKAEFQINVDVTASEIASMMNLSPITAGGAPVDETADNGVASSVPPEVGDIGVPEKVIIPGDGVTTGKKDTLPDKEEEGNGGKE